MNSQIARTLKLNFKNDLCIFCGSRPSTRDGDHIFARGFYPEDQHTKGDVVFRCPSCRPCQEAWNQSEEYLISILPAALNSAHHPAAQKVLAGPISRARQTGHGPARAVYAAGRPVRLTSPSGLPIGIARETKLDAVRFQPALRKILWGLAYLHLGEVLPSGLECGAFHLDPASFRAELNRLESLGAGTMNDDRNHVGSHLVYRNPHDPDEVECLVAFYPDDAMRRGLFFHVKTASFRAKGDVIELRSDLPADQDVIRAGTYIVVGRSDGAVEIACAGYDLAERSYRAMPGKPLRVHPSLLVLFSSPRSTSIQV